MEPAPEKPVKPIAGVRFFDASKTDDFARLKETVESPGVRKWMSDLFGMRHKHYYEWMGEQGRGNFYLFAVVIADDRDPEFNRPQGFIYIYPSDLERGALDVSFAKRANGPSGLMAQSLRKACLSVRELYGRRTGRYNAPLQILADIERDNEASMRVVQKAGFEEDEEYEEDNAIYVLDWDRLKEIESGI